MNNSISYQSKEMCSGAFVSFPTRMAECGDSAKVETEAQLTAKPKNVLGNLSCFFRPFAQGKGTALR